ncbi:MAG: hypothetical protein WCW64_10940 [Phycisphaerae bacterium]
MALYPSGFGGTGISMAATGSKQQQGFPVAQTNKIQGFLGGIFLLEFSLGGYSPFSQSAPSGIGA